MPYVHLPGSYYIELKDGLPRAVAGRIAVRKTTGRENPPDPLSGFACAKTPFAKGHIMALELGGPDIQANIVPQYGQWQGVGEWREMETTVARNLNGNFFVALLWYNFASNDYASQFQRFASGEVFDWNHEAIPNRIEIRVLDAGPFHNDVAGLTRELNATAPRENAFSALFDSIRRLPEGTPPLLFRDDFYQWEMPEIDRDYWLGQQVFGILDDWYGQYKSSKTQQSSPPPSTGRSTRRTAQPPAPVLMDDMTFSWAGANSVKQALREKQAHGGGPMWDTGYLDQKVTPQFCVQARFTSVSAKQWNKLSTTQAAFPFKYPP